jgi:hypothetical protein
MNFFAVSTFETPDPGSDAQTLGKIVDWSNCAVDKKIQVLNNPQLRL